KTLQGSEPTKAAVLDLLAPSSNKDILARMLRNLKNIYTQNEDWSRALSAVDRILMITPESAEEYRDRGMIYFNLECFRAAQFDLQTYLKMLPVATDAISVRERLVEVQTIVSRLN